MASTPIRRSTRGLQPLISPQKPSLSKFRDQWLPKAPIYVRQTRPSDDLPMGDEEIDSDYDWETRFYTGFARHYPPRATAARRTGKGKGRAVDDGDEDEDLEEFEIGDTVLVRGSRKEDSVGVIVSAWEVKPVDQDLQDEARMDKMLVKVHWFMLPSELSRFAPPLDYQEDEIFYTTNQTAVLPLHTLLFHCNIKAPGKILLKKLPGGAHYTTEKEFVCQYGVRSGLFYSFNWDLHRQTALEAYPDEYEDDPPYDAWVFKITGKQANIGVAKSGKSEPQKAKTRRTDGSGRLKKVEIALGDEVIDSESEGSGSEEEYTQPDDSDKSDHEVDDDASVEEADGDHDFHGEPEEDFEAISGVGMKKRKRRQSSSPRKASPVKKRNGGAPKRPTSSKATAARRRGRKIRITRGDLFTSATQAADRQVLEKLPRNPYLRAMHLLHVAARPDALPGREGEFDEVLGSVLRVLQDESGGCIYISGVPGTGKTATVHAVAKELQKLALANETNPFTYVEINGLRLPEPTAAYGVLWEAVSGHDSSKEGHLKISPKEALKRLNHYFTGGRIGPSGGAYVVLMDELDQLVTAKQDVVYNFFNWPHLPHSKLIVIAVSNTHDLPERVLPAKVRSRLGMERIHFQPYSREQLKDIVNSRLTASREGLEDLIAENVMNPDAVTLAASRIANVTGDARRVLDICRRAVETVYDPNAEPGAPLKIVRPPAVDRVIKAMQNSPNAAYLKECSFAERLILAALIKCVKRGGVNEVKWADLTFQCHVLYDQLRDPLTSTSRRPTPDQLRMVLKSLAASRAVLVENAQGASATKAAGDRLVLMNIETGEVTRALCDVGGPKWQNLLGA